MAPQPQVRRNTSLWLVLGAATLVFLVAVAAVALFASTQRNELLRR
jgi:flagellar basal body-associated protein FliL